ncbi:phage tail protein [Kordia sp.]|uniref:phage tail protein n=1 Tax=Kordia sp. TaxID=1965332 RepID=UPI003D6AD2D7
MQQSVQTLKSCLSNLVDSLALPMIGEIKTISFSTVPNGWAKCDGQLLNILDYGTLFGLIGTTYGGDGVTTFALPNLQGKTVIHNDVNYALGQTGGTSENTLTVNQLPTHSHGVGTLAASHTLKGTVLVNEEDGESDDPNGRNFGVSTSDTPYNASTNDKLMAANNVQINGNISLSGTTASTGNGMPVNNVQPYLALNTIIALEGIDPSTI